MKKLITQIVSLLFVFLASNALAEKAKYEESFTQGELEQMLAPVALYPDSILTHLLIAATYPLEVIAADRWVKKHPDAEPSDALDMVEDKSWDPSVKALVPFPRLLERMSNNLEWTQKIGDAFLQDEGAVLDAIQTLRSRADQAGNLEKMEHMDISREDDKIIIQPVKREVVYVPYYDTRVVYGHWYWDHYPPVYWDWHWGRHYHYSYHRPFYWHPRVHIGVNFFWSAFHWHNHHVIVINRHHHHSRRYYRRSDILVHTHARRWSHNPSHRRGVAYRTESTRVRYNSNRPSRIETRSVRKNESRIANRSLKKDALSRSNRTVKTNRTRQERLRSEMSQRNSHSRGQRNERSSRSKDVSSRLRSRDSNHTVSRGSKERVSNERNSRAKKDTSRRNNRETTINKSRQRNEMSKSTSPRKERSQNSRENKSRDSGRSSIRNSGQKSVRKDSNYNRSHSSSTSSARSTPKYNSSTRRDSSKSYSSSRYSNRSSSASRSSSNKSSASRNSSSRGSSSSSSRRGRRDG